MSTSLPHPSLDRRGFLKATVGTGWLVVYDSVAFAASGFWNRKPSSQWSVEEVERLKTKSPWARKVQGVIAGGSGGRAMGGRGGGSMNRSGSSGSFGGMDGGESSGMGGGGGGRRGRGEGGSGLDGAAGVGSQGPEVVVRWESAAPILEAMKIHLPPELENHYSISVSGLPPQVLVMALNGRGRGRGRDRTSAQETEVPEDPAARQKTLIERLLRSATLSVKGRDSQTADQVRQTLDKQSLIFGFQKESLPLAAADKDVQFMMDLGAVTLKAKFELKDMMYKGELAI